MRSNLGALSGSTMYLSRKLKGVYGGEFRQIYRLILPHRCFFFVYFKLSFSSGNFFLLLKPHLLLRLLHPRLPLQPLDLSLGDLRFNLPLPRNFPVMLLLPPLLVSFLVNLQRA